MTPREQGFLLLTSHLGDPERKTLTVAQLRSLTVRVKTMEKPKGQRRLELEDLLSIGYDRAGGQRILSLLDDTQQLDWYVNRGARMDCYPVTRVSESYPDVLRRRLAMDCPGCLWIKGDAALLEKPAISLVGSRQLLPDNLAFAREAGRQAAAQGYVLISGNANGADRAAQDACLENGGQVISVVAESLEKQPLCKNVLYISEDGYDLGFSSVRALSRNRIIHCLGKSVLVAQSGLYKGGTWNGTEKNLRREWSPVWVFEDGSPAAAELIHCGAQGVTMQALCCLDDLCKENTGFLDQ